MPLHAEGGFGGGIGGSDGAFGAEKQQAGGHATRDFFGDAFGFAGAFLFGAVEAGELAFLRAKLFDHALH